MKLKRNEIAKNLLIDRTCERCNKGPEGYDRRCPCRQVIAVNKNTARIAYPLENSCEQWKLKK